MTARMLARTLAAGLLSLAWFCWSRQERSSLPDRDLGDQLLVLRALATQQP